jgi:anti-sigma factor RsiW
MQFINSLMPVLEMVLSGLLGTIRAKDYDNTQASLEAHAACPTELMKWSRRQGADHSLVDPQHLLMEKATKPEADAFPMRATIQRTSLFQAASVCPAAIFFPQ